MSIEDHPQVNLPAGLRDNPKWPSKNASIISDLFQTDAERPPGIHSHLQPDIERKFNGPNTGAPILEKDSLVHSFTNPAKPYQFDSKFNYAQGLEQVAKSQFADRNVQDIISANHQLKDGNVIGAEQTMGRPLTQEEVTQRQVTPPTGTGQYTPYQFAPNPMKGAEVTQLRDDFYKKELIKLDIFIQNGDTVDESAIRSCIFYMTRRGLQNFGPDVRILYESVVTWYNTHKGYNKNNPTGHHHQSSPDQTEPPPQQHEEKKEREQKQQEYAGEDEQTGDAFTGSGIGKIQKGHIQLGKFEFDRSKLMHGNELSLRYGKSKKKVNGMPNMKVSSTFKDHLMHMVHGNGLPKEPLRSEEHNFMHKLLTKSEADVKLKPAFNKPVSGDPMQRLYMLLAEMDAGNTSHLIIREVKEIVDKLEKSHHISSSIASSIRSSYF